MATKYMHLRNLTIIDRGSLTVAYNRSFNTITEEYEIQVGFSFCSPKEKSFVKQKGRVIANRRLVDEPISFSIKEKNYSGGVSLVPIFLYFAKGYAKKHNIRWMKEVDIIVI